MLCVKELSPKAGKTLKQKAAGEKVTRYDAAQHAAIARLQS